MTCPRCQHENPDDASFCHECGTRFEGAVDKWVRVARPGPRRHTRADDEDMFRRSGVTYG